MSKNLKCASPAGCEGLIYVRDYNMVIIPAHPIVEDKPDLETDISDQIQLIEHTGEYIYGCTECDGGFEQLIGGNRVLITDGSYDTWAAKFAR